MDGNNHYSTPKSEIIEGHKFELFGGWLRCFQVLHIISLALIVIMVVAFAGMAAFDYFEVGYINELWALGLEILPDLVFSIVVIKIVMIRQADIPQKIVKFLGYYVAATFVIYMILFYSYSAEQISEKPTSFWGSAIYYLIWSSYFRKSKRVKVYYGENSGE